MTYKSAQDKKTPINLQKRVKVLQFYTIASERSTQKKKIHAKPCVLEHVNFDIAQHASAKTQRHEVLRKEQLIIEEEGMV